MERTLKAVLMRLTAATLLTFGSLCPAWAAFTPGSVPAAGTATGQFLIWSLSANSGFGGWVATSSLLSNGSQVAIGGSIDAGSRLSVSPQAAAENGMSITLPSGSTANGLQVTGSSGRLFTLSAAGTLTAPTVNATTSYQINGTAGYSGSIPDSAQSLAVSGGVITGYTSNANSVVRKVTVLLGAITANTALVVPHGLGTAYCVWNVVDVNGKSVYPDVKIDATTVTLTFTSSYSAGAFRLIVEG